MNKATILAAIKKTLIAAGLAILGFLVAIFLGKLTTKKTVSESKKKEDIKEDAAEIKTDIADAVKTADKVEDTVIEAATIIEEAHDAKDKIASDDKTERVDMALDLGFKKKE